MTAAEVARIAKAEPGTYRAPDAGGRWRVTGIRHGQTVTTSVAADDAEGAERVAAWSGIVAATVRPER